eukprot:852056-Rhodomonas_salina.2
MKHRTPNKLPRGIIAALILIGSHADADQDRVPNLISLPGVASGAHEDFLVAQLAGGQTPAPPSHSLSHSQPSFSRSSSFRNSSSFRVRAAADSEDSSPSTTTTTSPTGRGIPVPEQPSSGPISGPAGGILPVLTRDFPSPTDEEVKEANSALSLRARCEMRERLTQRGAVLPGDWRRLRGVRRGRALCDRRRVAAGDQAAGKLAVDGADGGALDQPRSEPDHARYVRAPRAGSRAHLPSPGRLRAGPFPRPRRRGHAAAAER